MRENPENKGFTNGKYYYYQTTNGNWDIGPGVDKAKRMSMIWLMNPKFTFGTTKRKPCPLTKKDLIPE